LTVPNLRVTMNGVTIIFIEKVSHAKFLGVFVDDKLNWQFHISQICLKISRSLGVLNKVHRYLPQKIMITLYYMLIYRYFIYCNVLWGGS